MKKSIVAISTLVLFASIVIILIFGFNPEKMIENIKLLSCISLIIIPLVLISRGSLLFQRETYQILGRVAIYFACFCIPLLIIKSLNIIDISDTAISLCNLFLYYLLLLTFVFEITSCNKKVTIYQFIIASIVTVLLIILIYTVIAKNETFNILSFSKLSSVLIATILSVFSIPMVNYLFDKNDVGISNIDVLVNNYHEDTNKILNTTNSKPIEENIPQNNTIKEMPVYDIPIIKEPVSINNNTNSDQNNTNL